MGALLDTALSDAYAYIRTLDADEALGEILHMAPLLVHATSADIPPGAVDRLVGILFGALVGQAQARGAKVQLPEHGGGLHLCTLVERLLTAVEQERGS